MKVRLYLGLWTAYDLADLLLCFHRLTLFHYSRSQRQCRPYFHTTTTWHIIVEENVIIKNQFYVTPAA